MYVILIWMFRQKKNPPWDKKKCLIGAYNNQILHKQILINEGPNKCVQQETHNKKHFNPRKPQIHTELHVHALISAKFSFFSIFLPVLI